MDVTSSSSSRNQVFFTNLLLLGFDPVGMEKKHKICFKRDMFQLPNIRAFQVVSHFLFTKLDPQTSKDVFRTCWPTLDKKDEQEFRKACYNWLTKINRHALTRPSVLILSKTKFKYK
ncbi:HAUS augmin-like complex subunit 6 [Tachypleus tridentatus]|uniref:HAUS augmin-like complex subunit 6 n=1 Tax=Tachypleus tridentatus TaxID=6853 RepID=UPI003FD1CEA5